MANARGRFPAQLATALVGPLLNDKETARAFAALILKRLHGEAELAK